MPYFTITDFAAGMDLRRSPLTAAAGTLRALTNAHITPGGEIERRYAFQSFATVGAETRGLVSVNQKLYTFAPMTQEAINQINPVSRLNSHAYTPSITITVATNKSRVFVCQTAGTSAATQPAAYATAVDGDIITDGTATFKATTPPGWVADPPLARLSNHDYVASDSITVARNKSRIFICEKAGKTAAFEPPGYASAIDGTIITDGTATFIAKTPVGGLTYISPPAYDKRANSHVYGADTVLVASNPTRLFVCTTPGVTEAFEPPDYAVAVDGTFIIDGSAVFEAVAQSNPARVNTHAYTCDIVTVASNPKRLFNCEHAGTTGAAEPAEFATAVDGQLLIDGTAIFRASTPSPRQNDQEYAVDQVIAVAPNNRLFTCTVFGATASTEPAEYATAVEGTLVVDNKATFRAGKAYTVRANSAAVACDTITVASNKMRIFTCWAAGTSADNEPTKFASAVDNEIIVDGTAKFRASVPYYSDRQDSTEYFGDTFTVASNPTRIFTCQTTNGMTAPVEPATYASAIDGTLVSDGTCVFSASTPPSDWIVAAQPRVCPPIIEPTTPWGVGVMPLETTELFGIVDYDLFDNQVFVVAFQDVAGNVVRCYNGKKVPDANGFFCKTYKTKMFAVGGSVLYFSAIGNPADWSGTGSGAIDLSLEDSDMTSCIAIETYYDKLAILSKTATQLWYIDPDPLKNQYLQTLRDAGTIAWRSVLQYGSGDVMYLAPSGVRSLRARNSSLAAAVSDIGSPLDPVLQKLFETLGESYVGSAISLLQPVTGRFWIIFPDFIYVLSAFPGPKVTAWSQYEPLTLVGAEQTRFFIKAATTHKHHVVLRANAKPAGSETDNDVIYAYGGVADSGPVYDDCPVEVIFPFHAGDQPATYKTFQAIDAAATGKWEVSVAFNPNDDTVEDTVGLIDGPTFLTGDFLNLGRATHMSLRLRAFDSGPAVLSNLIVHYQLGASRGVGI